VVHVGGGQFFNEIRGSPLWGTPETAQFAQP